LKHSFPTTLFRSAAAPGVAHAGTYPMYACDVPGVNLPSPSRGAWVDYDTSGQIQHWQDCTTRTTGGSIWFQINYPSGVLAQNTGVGAELRIPSSGAASEISISRVTDWSATQLTAQGAGQAPAFGVNLAPSISAAPGGDATGWTGTSTSGPGHDSGALPPGTKVHRLGVLCSFAGGGYGNCTLPSPFLRIRGIEATLEETVQPSGAIEGGSMMFSGALKGDRTVSYNAQDAESGVEKVEVTLDGMVTAARSYARDLTLPVDQQTGECSYVGLRACPASDSGLLTVDTTRLPDGAYELGLRVTDAAGNSRTTVAAAPVVIDNVVDQPAPVGPTPIPVPGRAGADGRHGKDGAVLTLNGLNASAYARVTATFAGTRRGVIKSAYGKKVLITGRLVAPSGMPIIGARVAVMHQDKVMGAALVPAGEVVTDEDGKFRYVTTATRSRTIRFAYRAHVEDTRFAHTTDVALGVIAKVALRPSRRIVRNGESVTFRGSVAGAPARSRKVVELQVRKGSGWMTFRSTRLRNGRFADRYRFTRTRGRQTYVFRARVRQEAGFPFLTGHSKSTAVTVRG
jgi:hypothetical protein